MAIVALYFVVTSLLYLWSYRVLYKVRPNEAEQLALFDFQWYFSKSKSLYLGWLIAGLYVPLFRGTRYRWFFELVRILMVTGFIFVIYELVSLLPSHA